MILLEWRPERREQWKEVNAKVFQKKKKTTGRIKETNKNITKHDSSAVRLWWAATALEKGSKALVLHPCATLCPLPPILTPYFPA